MNDYFKQLRVGLPAVIQKYADAGMFSDAILLIDRSIDSVQNEAMRQSMLAHREMFLRTPAQFPYSVSDAMEKIRALIPDFQESELKDLMESNDVNWRYIEGEPRIFKGFLDNLEDECAYYRTRLGKTEEDASPRRSFIEETIAEMRETGGLGYHYRVKLELSPKEGVLSESDKTLVHIPVPLETGMIHNVLIEETSPAAIQVEEPSKQVGSAAFQSRGSEPCSVTFSFDNYCDYLDLYNSEGSGKEESFCLEEVEPHIVFTPYLKALAKEIVEGAVTPLQRARKIYDYITQNVVYAFMPDYITMEGIPDACARSFRGDCGVQVLLFITLCRICGVPARWQSGLECSDGAPSPHDWAQVYIDPYGWRNVDLTYGGGGRPEERRQFYFGNTDPLRMVTCCEFGGSHLPEKRFFRADPYDNQYGEIETETRGLWLSELKNRRLFLERTKFSRADFEKKEGEKSL